MRPAPVPSPCCLAAMDGGTLSQSRVELQWFSGMQGCGPFALAAYLPAALQASLWPPPAGLSSAHPLPSAPPRLCSYLRQTPRQGEGAKLEPFACFSPHPLAQEGEASGEHSFWTHLA